MIHRILLLNYQASLKKQELVGVVVERMKRRRNDEDAAADVKEEKDEVARWLRMNSGAWIPTVQFGVYRLKGEACTRAVNEAVRAGYLGVDSASIYANENEVGACISAKTFVQTKLWRSHQGSEREVKRALRNSLKKLNTDAIDLWLMHWPGPGRHLNYPPVRRASNGKWQSAERVVIADNESVMVPKDWDRQMRLETWRHMSACCGDAASGKGTKAIGVCNFSARQLRELVAFCRSEGLPLPAVCQNECHPLLPAEEVRQLCAREGIVFQAYSSLGSSPDSGLLENAVVKTIAKEHGKSAAQVLIRWALQNGCAVLPKSASTTRIQENIDVFDFALSDKSMQKLDALSQQQQGQNTMFAWHREHDPDFY